MSSEINFELFSKPIEKQFKKMTNKNNKNNLFLVKLDIDDFYQLYLNSFPHEVNDIFRVRRTYDCNCCRNFLKRVGALVLVKNNKIVESVFDVETTGYFQDVTNVLSEYIKSQPIERVFCISETVAGGLPNSDRHNPNILWNHFYVEIPREYVMSSDSIGSFLAENNTSIALFKRGLNELTLESGKIVLELINSNQIYRGKEYKHYVEFFIKSKLEYDKLTYREKDIYVSVVGSNKDNKLLVRFKNTVIGTLLESLSNNVDIETAVSSFESKVDSTNYRRTTAIVSPTMIEKAKKDIINLGYEKSLYRKMMSDSELSSENILWKSEPNLSIDIFDDIKLVQEQKIIRKKTSVEKGEEISIDDLIKKVLPKSKEISILFEDRLKNNLMTLVNSSDKNSKLMFKWDNDVSWSYNGDVTDRIKERVKQAGGDVVGDLRVSLSWSNSDDLDLHCYVKNQGNRQRHVYYSDKKAVQGMYLDLDMNGMDKHDSVHPVENIIVKDKTKLSPGIYKFEVKQFSKRNKENYGFTLQVEYDNIIHSFSYDKIMNTDSSLQCLEIEWDGNEFSIKNINKAFGNSIDTRTDEIWGININSFVNVNKILLSPNYWNDNKIGNKHFIFLVDGCYNNESVRSFYTEYLNDELYQHRKTMELLGGVDKLKAVSTNEQLSGMGFSETSQSKFIVRQVDKSGKVKIYNVNV